ncbi:MAG: CotH kinase family protein [Lachnospiraceae bacterium]|nr:CotH kinase family protein [Lachnospiraceae bacterium]
MVVNKHISKIIIAIMAVAVIACLLAVVFADKLSDAFGGTGVTMEYESKLFDTDEIISIDIQMDEEEWENMISNALSEEYYVCDVVINGTRINDVAIRPKGNTSLSSIVSDPDSDRFSMKLEFDHFVDGQTCFGLDKLILNNNYADATNMKEALIYDMYQFIGAEASLYNYAEVSVNGEYWGVYLALEGVEQSFMLRNFGTRDGELYKPDSMEMGGDNGSSSGKDSFGSGPGNMPDMGNFSFDGERPEMSDAENSDSDSERPERPDMGDFEPGDMPGGGMFSFGSGGANLNYSDDDLDSYQTIWDGSITETGDADHRRVVEALKNISEGNDIEKYIDVENVLKYMAVHAFAVNMDSLSGSMAHNYYLYEYDGQLNIFPWDYNLSFGGMSMGKDADATEMMNDAIDDPFSATNFFDALLENEEYLEIYHSYLQQLVEEYVEGGRFDEVYLRIRNQIDELVETDPTAFYDYDEYINAVRILYETVQLRAESIKGQLDGTIPSTESGQRQDSSSLIDASHIDIKAMGTMNMGGSDDEDTEERGKGGPGGGFGPGAFAGGSEGTPQFPGMPGQTDNNTRIKNLITYGICFAVMIALIIVLIKMKKRR